MSSLTRNPHPIAVLVYHQIEEAPSKGQPFRSLYVSPSAFTRQMYLLKLLGYQGLSMGDLQPYLSGERSGKVVGITFDDGYVNNLVNALPVLRHHGFSSTCYAVSGLAGKTNKWDEGLGIAQTPLMDEKQMRQWVDGGQEIGSHTRNHVNLASSADMASETEIASGKSDLEIMLNGPIRHFCYPYGRYEPKHVNMVRQLDFATATTTQRSRCVAGDDVLEIPRVPILRSTSLPMFWIKIATGYEDRRRK
ncbi:MAG: polysaccharide deacetylase family protein [Pseudomonadota bacterium]